MWIHALVDIVYSKLRKNRQIMQHSVRSESIQFEVEDALRGSAKFSFFFCVCVCVGGLY